MNGKLIVIEGLDGSGKATQTELLYQALKKRNKKVRTVSFPDYKSDSSALVRMYLAGEFGGDPGDVNAYAASAFYAVDRFASYKKDWGRFYHDGGIIIADRYTTSNAIHQCAKLPKEQWDSYLHWLYDLEYSRMGIPTPDTVIYLQTDTGISQKLMSGRYRGDESRKDIHESNLAYMNCARTAAEYCAGKLGWKTVHCISHGQMRDIADIHAELLPLID